MQLTDELRTLSVEVFLRTNSCNEVIATFQQRYPERNSPSFSTIRRNVAKFRTVGSISNQNAGSGRLRTSRTPENINRVQQALEENPNLSSRRNGLGLSYSIFNEITRLDLNFHPF